MKISEFRSVIQRRIDIEQFSHGEWAAGIEECWKKEIELLSEDVSSTIDFLTKDCTADEFSWISEILDELAEKTKSRELIVCYRSLMSKYPEESVMYSIQESIESAENILDKRV